MLFILPPTVYILPATFRAQAFPRWRRCERLSSRRWSRLAPQTCRLSNPITLATLTPSASVKATTAATAYMRVATVAQIPAVPLVPKVTRSSSSCSLRSGIETDSFVTAGEGWRFTSVPAARYGRSVCRGWYVIMDLVVRNGIVGIRTGAFDCALCRDASNILKSRFLYARNLLALLVIG